MMVSPSCLDVVLKQRLAFEEIDNTRLEATCIIAPSTLPTFLKLI
jgi:hypothetical protein